MTRFEVDGASAFGVHQYLNDGTGSLAGLVADSRRARTAGSVEWRVTVSPASVYGIGALQSLAEDEGVRVTFRPLASLDERQRAFFDDHVDQQMARRGIARARRRIAEMAGAALEVSDALLRLLTTRGHQALPTTPIRTAVIVGAYGGDHVGDAAILGGVLLGLHARYGVTRATVMSFRAEHTRRLAAGLATPVSVTVAPYSAARVARLLDGAEALVIAGGPFVDLPRVLAKHLGSALAARRRGRPLLIERVGVGDFHRGVSRWAARKIVRLAAAISVRSRKSAAHPLLAGASVTVDRDPAFDYLATRHTLDRLTDGERDSIDRLLCDAGDSVTIGINLRPVNPHWHPDGPARSQALEQRFFDHLADALEQYAAASPRPVTYVFFPMNAEQFGMSDLSSAYRLQRALARRVPLRVWETDPCVDAVLCLLRRLDAVVVMRLHAAIFAMSQDVPAIGIDYFSGYNGKLTALFSDVGRADALSSMEAFEASWLVERLRGLARQAAGAKRGGSRALASR